MQLRSCCHTGPHRPQPALAPHTNVAETTALPCTCSSTPSEKHTNTHAAEDCTTHVPHTQKTALHRMCWKLYCTTAARCIVHTHRVVLFVQAVGACLIPGALCGGQAEAAQEGLEARAPAVGLVIQVLGGLPSAGLAADAASDCVHIDGAARGHCGVESRARSASGPCSDAGGRLLVCVLQLMAALHICTTHGAAQ